MKRASIALSLVLGLALAGAGLSRVYGQEGPPPKKVCPLGAKCPHGPGPMQHGMMGAGPMSPGGMGPGPLMMGGHGMCPLTAPGAKVETKNLKNGIQVTITSDDAKTVTRLQKMAEIMRLTRELQELDVAEQKGEKD